MPNFMEPLFFLAILTAIIVVAIPAEHPDKSKTGTDGYPGDTEIKSTELIEHFSTFTRKKRA